MGEEIGRWICTAFGQIAGLSGWMVRKSDIEESLPCGTVTLCEKIGHELRRCARMALTPLRHLHRLGLNAVS